MFGIGKSIKIGLGVAFGLLLTGGLLFGKDFISYLKTSTGSVQAAVKDAVPIEFELRRAHDLVEELIPEMHANIKLIAQEEVEVASIKSEIREAKESIADEKKRVRKLADLLGEGRETYTLGEYTYNRQQLKDELNRRFELFKESEVVLSGKERLLEARERSLLSAIQVLDRSKTQKSQLETQVQLLESKYRTLKAASVGTGMQLDNSKLAQTEKLIQQIHKRLDVSERVLAHEAKFAQPLPLDVVDEKELLSQVKDYFEGPTTRPSQTR